MNEETKWRDGDREWRLRIEQDDSPTSPREWDNVGTFYGWHRSYQIGDGPPAGYEDSPTSWFEEWKAENPDGVILPVFMYDHGGVAYSCESFVGRAHQAAWDSGQVGVIFATRETIKKGLAPDCADETVEDYLKGEVETYSQWASGDVWGFVLESRPVEACGECGREHGWEHEDSCWGFYGDDPKENGMLDHWSDEVTDAVGGERLR